MNRFIVVPAALAVALLSANSLAQDAAKLAQQKQCLACHTVDKKLIGPTYKEVAAKYRSRKDGEAYLAKKIREGSNGVWGQIPMPPNAAVNEAEAKTLAKWVLQAK